VSELIFGRYNKNSDTNRCCPNDPIQNAIYASGNIATCNFVCNPGFEWSNTSLSCISCPRIPANSTFTRGCEHACKSGYAGNPCISCSDYLGIAVPPPGGTWNMSTCSLSCLSGYRFFSDFCCPVVTPPNAQVGMAPTQCNFVCNEGYRWDRATLSCSVCPGYVHRTLNNTIWGMNCKFECKQGFLVPPNSDYFECFACSECQNRCLHQSYPVPSDADVVWTFNNSLTGPSKCQWTCPASKPQLSGTRCCSNFPSPSAAYKFVTAGACSVACSPGYDAFTDPRNTQFALQCVPCSRSYRAPYAPVNGFWSDQAPLSGTDNCQYLCKPGFTMFNSNGTDMCCKLPQNAVLKSSAKTCDDWVCRGNTYLFNGGCYDISIMSTVCAKHDFCSQCLATLGCGWCESSQSCAPGTVEGSSLSPYSCDKWKFGSCADDCPGRICETCTNLENYISDSPVKCSWCSTTGQCIRSETADKSCRSESTISSLETCTTQCSIHSDCPACASSAGCTYCSAKSACISNTQYNFLTDNPKRYNYFCDKIYGKNLPGTCPSSADSMYLILIVSLGTVSCACFLWFLCARSNFIKAICNCCSSRENDFDDRASHWGDHEMGQINPYNGQGLDPNILLEFPLIKFQLKSDSNIKFQEDGFVFCRSNLVAPNLISFHQGHSVLFCVSW
jgi:hypothetical protein